MPVPSSVMVLPPVLLLSAFLSSATYECRSLVSSVFTQWFATLGYIISRLFTTLEFEDFQSNVSFGAALLLYALFHAVSEFMILYYYTERFLIITNRLQYRRFAFLALLPALPLNITSIMYGAGAAAGGVQGFIKLVPTLKDIHNVFQGISAVSRVYTCAVDCYILFYLKKRGLNTSGYNKTRIFHLVFGVCTSIVVLFFDDTNTNYVKTALRWAIKGVLLAADCLIILDFFAIDVNRTMKESMASKSHPQSGIGVNSKVTVGQNHNQNTTQHTVMIPAGDSRNHA
ncbi:hypothetical protein BKA69DRAFT_1129167 [Paraphysoderma sedebokerense]|nr:hypothetical protein BKA69DRAFT_1129167 [Paraphysoderma sedebokerense]